MEILSKVLTNEWNSKVIDKIIYKLIKFKKKKIKLLFTIFVVLVRDYYYFNS